jgi:hypothetical protein
MRAAVVPSAWWKPRWNSTKFVGGSDLQSWRSLVERLGEFWILWSFFVDFLCLLWVDRDLSCCAVGPCLFTFHADTCQMLTYADIWWPHQMFSRATRTV